MACRALSAQLVCPHGTCEVTHDQRRQKFLDNVLQRVLHFAASLKLASAKLKFSLGFLGTQRMHFAGFVTRDSGSSITYVQMKSVTRLIIGGLFLFGGPA